MPLPTISSPQLPAAPSSRDRRPAAVSEAPARRDVAVLVYRIVVTVVLGLVLAGPGGAVGLLSPWFDVGAADHTSFELHRWHATDISAFVTLLLAGSLLASLRRPRERALLVQSFVGGCVLFAAVSPLLPDPTAVLLPVGMMSALVVGSYPQRRALLRIPPAFGRRLPAVAAAAVATPFLMANAWQNLERQVAGVGEHAALGHWAGAAALAAALLLSTWLATSTAASARILGVVVAGTYVYLGAAALVLPQHDGSWSSSGAAVALVVGALLLAAVRRPSRWQEIDR